MADTNVPWQGLNHLALITNDMDTTVRFWHGVMGAPLVATIGTPTFRHYFFKFGESSSVAFFQYGDLLTVGKVLLLAWGVQLVDNWVVQPALLRTAVELHPVTVVFVLLLGGQLFGFLGLLFAVPAVCVLKEAAYVVWEWTRAEQGLSRAGFSGHALRIPYL